jgi:hypothetical protein
MVAIALLNAGRHAQSFEESEPMQAPRHDLASTKPGEAAEAANQ